MNGSLGRDKVWNQQIWSDIDKAVQEEVGRIRVAQKVFPSTVVNNVLPVSMKRVVPFGAPGPPPGPTPDEFQPFFEISREFVLTQAEVDGEENVHLAIPFAKSAASVIANAEDRILFRRLAAIPLGVNVTNQPPLAIPAQFASIPPGFVGEAAAYLPTPWYGIANILTAIADGKARLNGRNQPGPYALFLSPTRYGQTFTQLAVGLLQTPGDQIPHLVTGGFNMVNGLMNNPGILVSLGGEPTTIILGTDAITAFTHTDAQGNYHFRVFERIQLVVRDGRAFQTLRIF
jgi:uncharacterized linocin/CFP29 family protein